MALTAAVSAACAAVVGCSSTGNQAAAASDTQAQRAIKLAATRSADVSTLTARLAEDSTGKAGSGLTGTIAVQLKPKRLIQANFTVPAKKSKSISLEEILTSTAIYFKDPAFTKGAGKSWVKVDISSLSSKTGLTIASLLQNLEGSNPLDQTTLFTASKDVKVVGSRVVLGIPTTEYAGSYAPATAFAQLSPRLRKLLGPTLRAMGTNPVHFHVWIDSQHLIRKARDVEKVNGQTYTTTFDVTSVNTPVSIRLPAASQVAPLPKI